MTKAVLKNGDVLSGAVLAALGIYIVAQASAWEYFSADGPGPGFFPLWYGVAMTALALVLIVNAARNSQMAAPEREEPPQAFDWTATGRALGTWAAFALAVALMAPLGFLISFALLTFFIVAWVFRKPFLTAGITAVVTALSFHLVFPVALGVDLPTGLFGF
jgi:putative tricarboxylic transport membrane protein